MKTSLRASVFETTKRKFSVEYRFVPYWRNMARVFMRTEYILSCTLKVRDHLGDLGVDGGMLLD
jgi:hypothetical protein